MLTAFAGVSPALADHLQQIDYTPAAEPGDLRTVVLGADPLAIGGTADARVNSIGGAASKQTMDRADIGDGA